MNRIAATALIIALAGAAPLARAQWYPFLLPPSAPTNLTPAAGTYEGRAAAPLTPLLMTWSQYFPGGGPTLTPPATHFIICFDPISGSTAPACTVSNADWTETIASPSPSLVRAGNNFMFAPRTVAVSELDRDMRLTLGACSQLVTSSCRFVSRDLYYSGRNIVAEHAGTIRNSTDWIFQVKASNSGTTDAPAFAGAVQIAEVLFTGTLGRTCDTNVNAGTVRFDRLITVIDEKGNSTPMLDLQRDANGNYDGAIPIAGMYRYGSVLQTKWFNSGGPLAAGTTPGTNIAQVTFAGVSVGPMGPGQRTFVVINTLDTAGLAAFPPVREYDETDNRVARCERR